MNLGATVVERIEASGRPGINNMKRRAANAKTRKKIDWAVEVRKHKARLNALTDAERQELFEEGLALIHGAVKAERHARSR